MMVSRIRNDSNRAYRFGPLSCFQSPNREDLGVFSWGFYLIGHDPIRLIPKDSDSIPHQTTPSRLVLACTCLSLGYGLCLPRLETDGGVTWPTRPVQTAAKPPIVL